MKRAYNKCLVIGAVVEKMLFLIVSINKRTDTHIHCLCPCLKQTTAT